MTNTTRRTWRRVRLSLALLAAALPLAALAQAPEPAPVEPRLIASGLTAPIALERLPDGSGRRLILDQSGLIRVLDADDTLVAEPFLDLRDRMLELVEGFEERGLLGMAVHPRYANEGRVFVTYTAPLDEDAPGGWSHTRVLSEFTRDAGDPERLDPGSERVLLRAHWPSRKHNGGALAFGPDGLLHVGFGDGGGIHGIGPETLRDAFSVPPEHAHWDSWAQDIDSLYGKVLRLDVDRGYPTYAVPADNPFVGRPGRDEIYAWGFRNPYRIAFDGNGDGSFYVTAVAETLWEAIYHVAAPANYGWALYEGTHCFDRLAPLAPPADCARPEHDRHGYPIVDPIVEYPNMSVQREGSTVAGPGVGTAVVGALRVRTDAFGELDGKLLFADWSRDFAAPSGQLFVATPPDGEASSGAPPWSFERVAELDTRVVALADGGDGAIYALTNDALGPFGDSGKVWRLVPASR